MMNPLDFILLALSFIIATLSLLAHGLTINGVGPALLATAGGLWQLWMQWLRHRSWLRHRDSGFAPGTQHLAMAAIAGWSVATIPAVIWAVVALRSQRTEGSP